MILAAGIIVIKRKPHYNYFFSVDIFSSFSIYIHFDYVYFQKKIEITNLNNYKYLNIKGTSLEESQLEKYLKQRAEEHVIKEKFKDFSILFTVSSII